jgi:hypothetical protein
VRLRPRGMLTGGDEGIRVQRSDRAGSDVGKVVVARCRLPRDGGGG